MGAVHHGLGLTVADCAAAGEVLYAPPGQIPHCVFPQYANPAYVVGASGTVPGVTQPKPQYPPGYVPTQPSSDPSVYTSESYIKGLNENMWMACAEQLGIQLTQAQYDAAWAYADAHPGATVASQLPAALANCNVGQALYPPPPSPVIPISPTPAPVVLPTPLPPVTVVPTPAGGGVTQTQIGTATGANPPASTTSGPATIFGIAVPSVLTESSIGGIPNWVLFVGGGIVLMAFLGRKR